MPAPATSTLAAGSKLESNNLVASDERIMSQPS
jgi:hypothetical protein